jgi:hypothetical protein
MFVPHFSFYQMYYKTYFSDQKKSQNIKIGMKNTKSGKLHVLNDVLIKIKKSLKSCDYTLRKNNNFSLNHRHIKNVCAFKW